MQIGVAQMPVRESLSSLIVTPSSSIAFFGFQGGPFSPSQVEYRLSASMGTVSYSIKAPSWLTASSTSGATDTSGVTIRFSVNASASTLPPDLALCSPKSEAVAKETNGSHNRKALWVLARGGLRIEGGAHLGGPICTAAPHYPVSYPEQLWMRFHP